MSYKEFIEYDLHKGLFFILKEQNKRQIFPDSSGYLTFFRSNKSFKIKANRVAIELGNNIDIPKDKVILHKNLNTNDYRLQNLCLVTRSIANKIKEAHKNLSGYLKLIPHPKDAFSYIVQWKEDNKSKKQVVHDIVVAKKLFVVLRLKFTKIINRYCIFD